MAGIRLPAYTRPKAAGYYWERPSWADPKNATSEDPRKRRLAVRHGKTCPIESTALGPDLGEAIKKAEAINEAFKGWCKGEAAIGWPPGSIGALFAWYRGTGWFRKLSHKTRTDYEKLMNMVCDVPTKKGAPRLGMQRAAKFDSPVADQLYEKLKKERGVRQAAYTMQVCKLVWNKAIRPGYRKLTGVAENPFIGQSVETTVQHGNRGTSRSEYDLYRETARELGFQSMASAAALSFEGVQRPWDVFGYPDPDGRKVRGFAWEDYVPGVTIGLRQSKTGNIVTLPLTIEVPGEDGKPEVVPLYPELEEELARSWAARPADAEFIVLEERNGKKYAERRMSGVHRKICDAAGLPKNMTFTGFRHGGATEIGASGEADIRPVSGHKTLAVTAIYNKANEEKARRIAAVRREHVALLRAGEEEKKDG